jgi:hypothetical protein
VLCWLSLLESSYSPELAAYYPELFLASLDRYAEVNGDEARANSYKAIVSSWAHQDEEGALAYLRESSDIAAVAEITENLFFADAGDPFAEFERRPESAIAFARSYSVEDRIEFVRRWTKGAAPEDSARLIEEIALPDVLRGDLFQALDRRYVDADD